MFDTTRTFQFFIGHTEIMKIVVAAALLVPPKRFGVGG